MPSNTVKRCQSQSCLLPARNRFNPLTGTVKTVRIPPRAQAVVTPRGFAKNPRGTSPLRVPLRSAAAEQAMVSGADVRSADVAPTDVEQARISDPDVADAGVQGPQVEDAGAERTGVDDAGAAGAAQDPVVAYQAFDAQ